MARWSLSATSIAIAASWTSTKNVADDIIHKDDGRTFYCGCLYSSNRTNTGSGTISDLAECGYKGPQAYSARAGRVEWEHIVPASLMPVRQFDCWTEPGGSRAKCERTDPDAQAMIFDLHNLVPSIGQVNALRSNDRYAELSNEISEFGECEIEDTAGAFEPPDCKKGDVARVWLYMGQAHGVVIPAAERTMFLRWSMADPISPWESEREKRIADYSGVENAFVHGEVPNPDGACSWELGNRQPLTPQSRPPSVKPTTSTFPTPTVPPSGQPVPIRSERYGQGCECPYDHAINGSLCGKWSAFDRSGGEQPVCYVDDRPSAK